MSKLLHKNLLMDWLSIFPTQEPAACSHAALQPGRGEILPPGGSSAWTEWLQAPQSSGTVSYWSTSRWDAGSLLLWSPTTLKTPGWRQLTEKNLSWVDPSTCEWSAVSPGVTLFAEAARSLRGEVLTGLMTGDLAQKWWRLSSHSPPSSFIFLPDFLKNRKCFKENSFFF